MSELSVDERLAMHHYGRHVAMTASEPRPASPAAGARTGAARQDRPAYRRIIYASDAALRGDTVRLARILRRLVEAREVKGSLVFDAPTLRLSLEGPVGAVDALGDALHAELADASALQETSAWDRALLAGHKATDRHAPIRDEQLKDELERFLCVFRGERCGRRFERRADS